MSVGNSSHLPVSLEQLVALNDEMAALVRAGIPLEHGLIELSDELPGRVGDITAHIGRRLREGETLPQILASDEQRFPPVWRAVVEAGIRSGRLSSALEGLSTTARHVVELRRAIIAAWIYPLVVMTLAYILLVCAVVYFAPVIYGVYEDLQLSPNRLLESMRRLGTTVYWWGPAIPLVAVVVVGSWYYRTGHAVWRRRLGSWRAGGVLTFLRRPTVGQALRDGRIATFAETLALLIDHELPLPDALVLAADASGDPDLREGASSIRQRLAAGETFASRDQIPDSFPPLTGWLLVTGLQHTGLSNMLRSTASMYRRRAAGASFWAATYLPLLLTAIVGGGVTLLLALTVFLPVIQLLYALG